MLTPPAGFALVGAFVLSLQAVIYTYDGWSATIYFSEEVENPGRDIPRSLVGGVVAVIAIYLLVNLSLLSVRRWRGWLTEICPRCGGRRDLRRWGDPVFRILTIVSMLAAINSITSWPAGCCLPHEPRRPRDQRRPPW